MTLSGGAQIANAGTRSSTNRSVRKSSLSAKRAGTSRKRAHSTAHSTPAQQALAQQHTSQPILKKQVTQRWLIVKYMKKEGFKLSTVALHLEMNNN